MPGEIVSGVWPLFVGVPSLWELGGKLPLSVEGLNGEILGTSVEGVASGAAPTFQ